MQRPDDPESWRSPGTPVPRPALHLTVHDGWMNDPLALTHHDGTYHLFFQYVPGVTAWGPQCWWGHAISDDLFHWTEQPPVLAPGPDEFGCWSGSMAVPPDGDARLFYTSVDAADVNLGRIRVARPVDDTWLTWQKGDVVAELPDDVPARVFRDPCLARLDGEWLMVVGAGLRDGTGCALLWTSPDLADWTYAGPLASRHRDEREPLSTGQAWECPQLLTLDGHHVLVFSIWDQDELYDIVAAVGRYADHRFTPVRWQRLSAGSPYAASAFRDAEGRSGLIAWLRGVTVPGASWVGAQSCPVVLSVVDGRVRLEVHPGLARLRRTVSGPGSGPAATVDIEWSPPDDGADRLLLLDPDGATLAELETRPGGDGGVALRAGSAEVVVPRGEGTVRVLVDGPVLEVVTDVALGGLPFAPPPAGVRPEASVPDQLRWWRLAARVPS